MSLRLSLGDSASAQAVEPRGISLGEKASVVIGRDKGCDWQLPDAIRIVSSRHCEILREGSAYWLHDYSTNGTFINGAPQRLAAPHRLCPGDRIRIGNYLIAVEAEDGADLSDETIASRPRRMPAAPPQAAPPQAVPRGADPASLLAAAAANGHEAGAAELTMIAPAPRAVAPEPKQAAAAAAAAPAGGPPIVKHFARGLGLAEADIALADAAMLAEHAGALLRSLTAGLMPLLAATAPYASPTAPGAPRNALEDAPNPPAALEMLFGPPRRAYLDAERAYKLTLQELLERMQRAAAADRGDALAGFSPAAIEQKFAAAGRRPKFMESRKAALWDFYAAQWAERGRNSP
jgi:type VI secretion system protein ImpI